MIVSVALNPALDRVCICDDYSINGVNRVKLLNVTAGGKALNVSRVVKSLGRDICVIGVIGGPTGQQIDKLLTDEGINRDFVVANKESRICTTIIDNLRSTITQCNELGPHIDEADYCFFWISIINIYIKQALLYYQAAYTLTCLPAHMLTWYHRQEIYLRG